MTRFDLISAETKKAIKTNANAHALKATTALASALTIGLGIAAIAPLVLTTRAQAADISLGANEEWADTDSSETATDVGDAAAAGDNVNFTADVTLTVTNDGNNDDGSSNTNTFEIGAVTSTNSGEGTVAVQANAAKLTAEIASVGAADTSINALNVTGGNATGNTAGFTAETTVTGAAYAGTITISGGTGGNAADTTAGASGGEAKLVLHAGATGNIILDNGAAGESTFNEDETLKAAGGDGGTATLSIGDGFAPPDGGAVVAQTITGSIMANEDGDGKIVINNKVSGADAETVTITGDVGASDKAIGLITHNDAGGSTTYDGSVYVDTYDQSAKGDITINGDFNVTDFEHKNGLLTFSGTTAQTITVVDNDADDDGSGTAGLVSAGGGDITVTNTAGVTFTNDVTVSSGGVYIADNSSATFGGNVYISGTSTTGKLTVAAGGTAVFNGGTLRTVGSTSTVTDGTLQVNDTLMLDQSSTDIAISGHTKLVLGMTSGTAITAAENTAGSIVDLNSDNAAVDSLTFVAANGMKEGNEVIIFTAAVVAERVDSAFPNYIVTHITNGTDTDVASSSLMDFDVVLDDSGNVVLTATSREIADIAADFDLSESESTQLLTAFNNSTISAFADFVGGLTDQEQMALLADQVAVQEETLTASVGTISSAVNQVATITVDRLASLRTGDAYGLEADQAAAGFATGDGAMSSNVWGKLFYNFSDQDNTDDANGYDADTSGLAIGSDTEVGANMRIGASLAMSQSEVDGKGSGDAQTDIDSYQLTVYGDLTQSDYFIDWQVGASDSSVETTTTIDPASGISGSNSDYDSTTYVAKVGLGIPMDLGGDMEGTSRFTPYGSFGFQRISSDDYDLIFPDDPGLNQTVSPDDVNEFTLSLGGRYTMSGQTDRGGTVSPQVRGAISYDFIGDTAEATSTYADQTSLTVKGTEAEKIGVSLGIGVNYVSDAASLGFDIDSIRKDGYASHTGALNFRLQF